MTDQPSVVHFSGYAVSLDGTPGLSRNCWEAIASTLAAVPADQPLRYLEWGSGNSTIAVLKQVRERQQTVHVTSVEHDRPFFLAMVESLLRLLGESTVRVERLTGPVLRGSNMKKYRQSVQTLESWFVRWNYLTGNKVVFESSDRTPNYRVRIATFMKQYVKGWVRDWRHRWYVLTAFIHGFTSASPTVGLFASTELFNRSVNMNAAIARDLLAALQQITSAARVTITHGATTVEYFLWPNLPSPLEWRKRTGDGLFIEFAPYVLCPVPGQYDVIFVDGRARVSCMKRIKRDSLLAPGGTLFVHDAFSPHLNEGFEEFGPFSFIDGSNTMADGSATYPTQRPPVLTTGQSLANLQTGADRELYFMREASA